MQQFLKSELRPYQLSVHVITRIRARLFCLYVMFLAHVCILSERSGNPPRFWRYNRGLSIVALAASFLTVGRSAMFVKGVRGRSVAPLVLSLRGIAQSSPFLESLRLPFGLPVGFALLCSRWCRLPVC